MTPKLFRALSSFILTFLILAVIITTPIIAQGTCPAIIQDAIRVLGNNCEGIGRNNACYGNVDVDALFFAGQETPFSRSGDLAQLINIQRITTSPINRARQEWGIALMSLQANIPDTLPGQAVIFLLMGDAEVETAVAEDGALASERYPITTRRSGILRADPSATSRILGFIPNNAQVLAERQSDDGEWLRVSYNGRRGWMMARMVQTIPNFSSTSAQRFTPMQSFYLRTGIGQPDCAQAPNTLMVQGPRNFSIDITVNGADIRIGSTVFLRNIAPDILQLIVAEGQATVYPDTPDARTIPAGSFTTICLDVPQDLGVDGVANDRPIKPGCRWTAPRPFRDWGPFSQLPNFPPEVLLYEFELPIRPQITADCRPNEEWLGEYVVVAGDTLTRIAPRYDLTAIELGFGNCLADYDLIRVGQRLRVPLLIASGDAPPPVVADAPVIMPTPLPPLFVDLALTATVSNPAPEENTNLNYSVTVSNIGTQDATGVIASVPFPEAQIAYINAIGDGIYDNLTGIWSIGTIPAGANANLTIIGTARPGGALQPAFNMNSTITALNEPDVDLSNNSANILVNIGFYTTTMLINDTTLVQANDGLCTLIEAINNANGNTVAAYVPPLLPGECPTGRAGLDVITLNTDVDVDTPLPQITSQMTMNGGGLYKISRSAGQLRLFDVAIAGNITFSDIALSDGAPAVGEDGGAIYNEGTVTLGSGTLVRDNEVIDGSGAGVYNAGTGTLIVDNATFANNAVNGAPATGGGAIKNFGVLIINNSAFNINNVNSTNGQGGAISSNTTITLNGCNVFNGNSAFLGGAIHLSGGNLTFTSTCNVFNSNAVVAGGDGGALYLASGGTYTVGGIFDGNVALVGNGGAIYMTAGTLTVNASTFQNNEAQGFAGDGGVLYVDTGAVTFNGSGFIDNNSATTNSTIVFANTSATVNFFGNTIDPFHNTDQCGGGGTFVDLGGNSGGDSTCYP